MTFAPETIKDLAAYWTSHGGVNLGIVGDAAHADRPSYHNGRDRAVARLKTTSATRIAAADYTLRLARDQAGASDAAAALDLGHKDKGELRSFSRWLVERCDADAPGTPDIREIIYSPDGTKVQRWSQPDHKVYPVVLDNPVARSHLAHTHISFYRDSEEREKVGLFSPKFEEDTVRKIHRRDGPGGSFVAKPGAFYLDLVTDTLKPADANPRTMATPVTIDPPIKGGAAGADRKTGYAWYGVASAAFILASDVVFTPDPAPIDCAQAIADDRAKARVNLGTPSIVYEP